MYVLKRIIHKSDSSSIGVKEIDSFDLCSKTFVILCLYVLIYILA